MALTDRCDVFASLSDIGINTFIHHVQRQRPSLVNYGTDFFIAKPYKLCHKPEIASGLPKNQPILTRQALLPVPGTTYGLHYCTQLTKLKIDFHPGGAINLPPELAPPLQPQRLALELQFCIGVGCPSLKQLTDIGDLEAGKTKPLPSARANDEPRSSFAKDNDDREDDKPIVITPLPVDDDVVQCVCIGVYAICHFDVVDDAFGKRLALRLDGLELVDIRPNGLEDILECIVKATLILGLLPRLRIPLDNHAFSLGEFGSLTVGPTPTSPQVPFNPSIANDALSLFIDVS
jgi:hypothetical protein